MTGASRAGERYRAGPSAQRSNYPRPRPLPAYPWEPLKVTAVRRIDAAYGMQAEKTLGIRLIPAA